MNIVQIVAFGVITCVIYIIVEKENKEIALCLSIIAGVIILLQILGYLEQIINMINNLIQASGVNKEYLTIVFKVVGITYLVEFAKSICEDANQKNMATKLELAGKVTIIALSFPIISAILTTITKLV